MLWLGFLIVLAALLSYEFFALFPVTRDFPWANLLLFGIGGIFLSVGLFRAFGRPAEYRGKVIGPILTALSVLVFAFFAYALFYVVRHLPSSAGAPRVGEKAPEFSLPDQNGKTVALNNLLQTPGTRAVVLVFYRGYW